MAKVTVALLAVLIASTAHAGNCRVLFRQQVVHHGYVQNVVQHHAQTLYLVSPELINKATIKKAIREELPSIAAEIRQQLNAPQSLAAPPGGVLQAKCVKCHTDSGSGVSAWDMAQGRTDSATVAWMEMLDGRRDPPADMKNLVQAIRDRGEQANYLAPFLDQQTVGKLD